MLAGGNAMQERGPSVPVDAVARVLFLHPSDELYGADRVLLNLLAGLDRVRFEPLVVLANDLPYGGLLARELHARGIEVRHLPIAVARRKYLSPSGIGGFAARVRCSVSRLSRLIEDERIDLVYTNTLAIWVGALAAAHTRRPHLWHVHEIVDRPVSLRAFLRYLVPRRSERVICVSRAVRDHLLVTPQARACGVLLLNGAEPLEWMMASGADVRAELGCAPDDVLIGMIGRISNFKAPDLFVSAASSLLRRHSHVRLCIAGDVVPGEREMLERVRQLIAASPAPDRIHLLGFRQDVASITAALDIHVVSSRGAETCSLSSVQAMLASKPVVATDVGAMRETISDGETGLIVRRDDHEALAQALEALVGDPARRAAMGRAGQERARAIFALDRQIREFNAILLETCPAAPRR
jgi:glycosyltransferase involved in cell wall biosynthesis